MADTSTKITIISSLLLPLACVAFGQYGSYLQHPQPVSHENITFTLLMITILGVTPVAIILAGSLITIAIKFNRHSQYTATIAIISYAPMAIWSIHAGRNTIF